MRYVKWTVLGLIALVIFGFFHYTLPQHDIARIVNTDVRRIDYGENSIFWANPDVGNATNVETRDVRFIETVRPNGRVMVYRNEDTGWGWPPYFKLDSSNLQTEASDLRSTAENPKWVVITHYGWRNELISIFPNAVAVRAATGPDERIIPWVNIVILTTLAVFLLFLRRVWLQFRERTVDPILDDAAETWDAVEDRAERTGGRFRRWIDSWRAK